MPQMKMFARFLCFQAKLCEFLVQTALFPFKFELDLCL